MTELHETDAPDDFRPIRRILRDTCLSFGRLCLIASLSFVFDFFNHGGASRIADPVGKAFAIVLTALPLFAMAILGVMVTFHDFRMRRVEILRLRSNAAATRLSTLTFAVGLLAALIGLVLLVVCFVGRPTPNPDKWFRLFPFVFFLQLIDCALAFCATRPNDTNGGTSPDFGQH